MILSGQERDDIGGRTHSTSKKLWFEWFEIWDAMKLIPHHPLYMTFLWASVDRWNAMSPLYCSRGLKKFTFMRSLISSSGIQLLQFTLKIPRFVSVHGRYQDLVTWIVTVFFSFPYLSILLCTIMIRIV